MDRSIKTEFDIGRTSSPTARFVTYVVFHSCHVNCPHSQNGASDIPVFGSIAYSIGCTGGLSLGSYFWASSAETCQIGYQNWFSKSTNDIPWDCQYAREPDMF